MKFKLILFVTWGFILGGSTGADYKTKYFEQFIDHFNFGSNGNKTYMQRYLIWDEHWVEGRGPILFYTGNEGGIVGFKDASGFLTDIAPGLGAMVVFAEHRYYGVSLPFGNESFSNENIGQLTVEQALADYVYLLEYLRTSYSAHDVPVITFGGSYGGILAAYMRIKYPNFVTGALAASAPLYWTSGEGNPHGFWESVTSVFGRHSGCVARVREGFADIERLAKQGKYDAIGHGFQTCLPIKPSSLQHLYGWVRNSFTILAMANYPYPANFLGPLPAFPVNVACKNMLNANTAMEGMLQATALLYNGTGTIDCYDIYKEYIECSDPTGCSVGLAARAWDYQGCTEVVLPGGSNNVTDMFPPIPFTPAMRAAYCEKNLQVTPRRNWLAMNFWVDNMNLASNIIFSNGELDPWKDGGVLHDLSPTLVALLVEEGAHHLDLRGSNPDDPASVIKVRQQELEIIKGWIAQHWAKKLGNTRGLKSYTQKQIEDVVRKVRWRKMT